MSNIIELVNKFGFPIFAAGGTGYMIYFTWTWATKEVKPVLSDATNTLVGLIDRIRMLDNDLIRLQQKISTATYIRKRDKN